MGKNGLAILRASIFKETETARKISSRNGTLGETKLIVLIYGKDSEKNRVKQSAK